MAILDTTIVNVALDTLSRDLHASLSATQWVITGYLLALGMVIPLSGWASGRFGTKRVWITALVLFTCGSALSGLAWSIGSLIGFRIVQGLGGGLMLPLAQTIMTRAAGPERLGRVMAILGVPMLLGPVFGPVIGGLLVQNVSWHWIFYVNVPVGVVAVALAFWKLPEGKEAAAGGRFDLPGLVLLAASCVLMFVIAIALFGGLLLLPLYYQVVRGQGALHAGPADRPAGPGRDGGDADSWADHRPVRARLRDPGRHHAGPPRHAAAHRGGSQHLLRLADRDPVRARPRDGRDDDAGVRGGLPAAPPGARPPGRHHAVRAGAGRRLVRHRGAGAGADPADRGQLRRARSGRAQRRRHRAAFRRAQGTARPGGAAAGRRVGVRILAGGRAHRGGAAAGAVPAPAAAQGSS